MTIEEMHDEVVAAYDHWVDERDISDVRAMRAWIEIEQEIMSEIPSGPDAMWAAIGAFRYGGLMFSWRES